MSTNVHCPVCSSKFLSGDPAKNCPKCDVPHHEHCWEYNSGCGIYGCGAKGSCNDVPNGSKVMVRRAELTAWSPPERTTLSVPQTQPQLIIPIVPLLVYASVLCSPLLALYPTLFELCQVVLSSNAPSIAFGIVFLCFVKSLSFR